jgi:hypothetical protein
VAHADLSIEHDQISFHSCSILIPPILNLLGTGGMYCIQSWGSYHGAKSWDSDSKLTNYQLICKKKSARIF